jgi:hypothetical protein
MALLGPAPGEGEKGAALGFRDLRFEAREPPPAGWCDGVRSGEGGLVILRWDLWAPAWRWPSGPEQPPTGEAVAAGTGVVTEGGGSSHA